MKTRTLKAMLSVVAAFGMLVTMMQPTKLSAAEPTVEPLYWNFTGDSDYVDQGTAKLKLGSGTPMEDAGTWTKGGNNTSADFWATDAHRLDINFPAGWGTMAVQTPINLGTDTEPAGIDGSKYDKIKLDIGALGLSGVESFTAFVAFEDGSTETNDIDSPAYRKTFAVSHLNATGLVEVDMSAVEMWAACTNISYLRIGVEWQGGFTPGSSRMLLDYVEICPKEEEENPPVTPDPPTDAEDMIYDFAEGDHGFHNPFVFDPPRSETVYNDTEKAMEGKMLLGYGSIVIQKEFDTPVDARPYKTVKVSVKNPTNKPVMATIGIANAADNSTVEGNTYPSRFEIAGNSNEYVDYYVQVAEAPNTLWPTMHDMKYFRLQICVNDGNMTANESIFVKKIEVLTEKVEAPPIEVDPVDIAYDFISDLQGFTGVYGVTAGKIEHDAAEMALKATMLVDGTGTVPFQRGLDELINGADYKTIKISLKNTTGKALTGALSYNLKADGTYVDNKDALIKFNISADSGWVDYYIQVGENEKWNAAEEIDLVRFYIGQDDLIKDGIVYVSRVELLTEKEEAPEEGDSGTPGGEDENETDEGTDNTDNEDDVPTTGVVSYFGLAVAVLLLSGAGIVVIKKRQCGEN